MPAMRATGRWGGLGVASWGMDEGSPAPDAKGLHEAALAHLARYATTRAGLVRVLDRRIARWERAGGDAEAAAAARGVARAVVARLAEAGLVDDAAFAEMRARSLTRGGRSRRAAEAHLRARGVGEAEVRAALPEDAEAEYAAALSHARRRRIGPWRRAEIDVAGAMKELAAMARAGFSREVARRALGEELGRAEEVINRLRQG